MPAGQDNRAVWRERIVASIAGAGRPAIALDVVGPPEPCAVAGYEDGGEVLVGRTPKPSIT